MRIAVTREVSSSIGRCELMHLRREAIDVERASAQHRQYEDCLAALGCQIHRLAAEPDLPDSVFVEDTAIVLEELAIITRPGAVSRRSETSSVAAALQAYRKLATVEAPGTLDGGDVLRLGKTLFIGLSGRSNPAGLEQIRALVEPRGYTVREVVVKGCLHLKSAVTQMAPDSLLINRAWVDASTFTGMRLIDVDPSEPFAANALLLGNTVVYPAAYPRTRKRLEQYGISVHAVDVSELAKAEGGVTCCSVIFEV